MSRWDPERAPLGMGSDGAAQPSGGVRLLVVAASVVMVLALVAGYARRAAVDSDQFANRATAALRDDYRGPIGADGLTLRQMIDRNRRVIFLAENRAGGASWYHLAYESITQETLYAFSKVEQLTKHASLPASCRPNRGAANAPLFLLNHWITTDPVPLPSNATKVNDYSPLLRRTRECRRIRKHLPNLVAVDFYRRGDLFRVVDTLNGVS